MPGYSGSAKARSRRDQSPALAQRRKRREAVSGLPNSDGRACQGGRARPGLGGEPEDGVERLAGVADGPAGAGGAEHERGKDGPLVV